jgi:hypothetical protein
VSIRSAELTDAAQLVAGDAHACGLVGAHEAPGDAVLPTPGGQDAGGDLEFGPEVVQVPAQVVDQRGALRDEALAMIDEQADVELASGQSRDGQGVESLADRGSGDRDGVDHVGLAALARRAARVGHQLRRHAHDALAANEQEALQRPGHVAAILDRPHALGAHAARPPQQVIERAAPGPRRSVAERAAGHGVDRGDGVRVLVGVRPDHDHPHRPFVAITDERIAGGHISVGAMPRSYQVTPEILGRRRATQHPSVRPAGRQKVNGSARRQPEDLPATPDATARTPRLCH